MAGEVPGAPDCGPARGAAHPEMAERRRAGGWETDTCGRRDAAGRQYDSPNAKDNFEFERRVEFRRKSGAR